jgi:chromosome segregation ATPase
MGLFGALWLLLAGAFLNHILQEQASTVERMNALERSQAALVQSREDQNRRLENIERKLSEIQDSLRKLY